MLEKEKLEKEANNAIIWIKDYVAKTGAKGIIVGNSGGKDSATVLAMAVHAIGNTNVKAVFMSCNSIKKDYEDAKKVADKYNVEMINVDLLDTFSCMQKEIENNLKINLSEESKINMKPRLRMTTLYSIAQTLNYIVIGTGNLCESMVGYTTKWGDNSSDFNPIANFTVSEVLEIGKMLGVPNEILEKAPSDGLGNLTDEEKMNITYNDIEKMIEFGIAENDAKEKIIKRYQSSKHKRNLVPTYNFDRKNYLKENY